MLTGIPEEHHTGNMKKVWTFAKKMASSKSGVNGATVIQMTQLNNPKGQ